MIRKGIKPRFRIGFDRPEAPREFRRVYPFRRPWPAILILLVLDIVFLIPAISTFRQMTGMGDGADSLFDLVGTLFLGAWLLGWSMAPLIMTAILLLLLFGREVVRAREGQVEIILGLPFIGLAGVFEVSRMRNLRVETPAKKSGRSWRGTHFMFDYGANSMAFGSDVQAMQLGEVAAAIQMASGKHIRKGDARPEELEQKWEPVPEDVQIEPLLEETVGNPPESWLTLSTLLLIAANLVPIAGTLFYGWRLSDVMVLYWAESAVIGFFNLCKIVVIGRWFALLAGPFFLGHFGGFMAVHFLFIYTIFVQGPNDMGAVGELGEVVALFQGLWPALLALFLSHAVSFYSNFLGRQEYRGRTVNKQMSEPYGRIIFMHLVLIFGGGLTLVLGETTPVLLGVIALKIFFDIRAHLKQHRGHGNTRGLVENPG